MQYKTTALGIVWGFAAPLLQLFVYSFIFRRVITVDIPNYGLFLFAGLLSWSWFHGSLNQASRSITEQGDLVRQPGFPVMVLPIVSVAVHLVNLLLALPLFLVFVAVTGPSIHATVLFLPLLLVLQFLLISGPAYLLGACNVRFRDTARIAQVFAATSALSDAGVLRDQQRTGKPEAAVHAQSNGHAGRCLPRYSAFRKGAGLEQPGNRVCHELPAVVDRLPRVRAHEERIRGGDRMKQGSAA